MKNILTICLLVIMSYSLFSQGYYPTVENDKTWSTLYRF